MIFLIFLEKLYSTPVIKIEVDFFFIRDERLLRRARQTVATITGRHLLRVRCSVFNVACSIAKIIEALIRLVITSFRWNRVWICLESIESLFSATYSHFQSNGNLRVWKSPGENSIKMIDLLSCRVYLY